MTSSRYSCRCQVLVGRDLHKVIDDAIHHYCLVLLAPIVFPPAPKKGMVKFPGKGHFKGVTTG